MPNKKSVATSLFKLKTANQIISYLVVFLSSFAATLALSDNCDFHDQALYLDLNADQLDNCLSIDVLSINDFLPVVENAGAWIIEKAIWKLSDENFEGLMSGKMGGIPLMHRAVKNELPEAVITIAFNGFEVAPLSNKRPGSWLSQDKGTTPLHIAFRNNKTDHAALLLTLGGFNTNKDVSGKTPEQYATGISKELYYVALGIHADDVYSEARLSQKPKVKKTNLSCKDFLTDSFFEMATPNDVSACMMEGAQIDGANASNDTALHVAARSADDPDIIWHLVSNLADFDQVKNVLSKTNLEGNTPLHEASAYSKVPDIVTRLLFLGADLNAKNHKGQSSLHLAAKRTDVYAELISARILSSKDAFGFFNVKVPVDNNGNTPLHYAAQKDFYGVQTRLLLMSGFDPDHRNNSGTTPLMLAAEDKIDRSRQNQDFDNENFNDSDQITSFLDILAFSENPCDPVPDKFSENAGITVYDIAMNNPSLKMADNSGADIPAIAILKDECLK